MKFGTGIHIFDKMHPNNFVDSMTFPLAPT